MSSFTSPLYLEDLGNESFRVLKAFSFHVGGKSGEEIIVVPENFVTDFASVPRVFWNVVPPHGRHGKAAVVHDYLYSIGGRRELTHPGYDRARCDAIFLEAMAVLGVRWLRRWTMFRAVRAFGWVAWSRARDEREEADAS